MLLPTVLLAAAALATDAPALAVSVNSSRHEVVLRLGPFRLDAAPAGGGAEVHHHHGHLEMGQIRFAWPVAGWARGFRMTLRDGAGTALSRELLHHVNLIHLDRRQLLTPLYERSLAVGRETGDAMLPRSTGVRLEAGAPMALESAWSNRTGTDYGDVTLELTLSYLPANLAPRPLDVRPMVMDVGYAAGVNNTFDVGPGRTVHRREFLMPIDGRLLGVGGHLHDYAESLQLVDVATGKVLITVRAEVTAAGKLVGVSRVLYGVTGDGLKLSAGRRYQVEAVYANPTGRTLPQFGMGVMVGVFAPDDPKRWPALDRAHPEFLADLAELDRKGWGEAARRP